MQLSLIILYIFINSVLSYNIETRNAFTASLGNGVDESQFAGYELHASKSGSSVSITVGVPRVLDVNSTTKLKGGLRNCALNRETSVNASSTSLQDGFSLECEDERIYKNLTLNGGASVGLTFGADKGHDGVIVCAPLHEKKCPTEVFQVGSCFNKHDGKWTTAKWKEPACFTKNIDFTFVVDGSASIGTDNFNVIRNWMIEFLRADIFTDLGSSVFVTVVEYGAQDISFSGIKPIDKSNKFRVVNFTDCSTFSCLEFEITNLHYLRSQTFTFYGLRRAIEVELPKSPNHKDSSKIFIILTDGKADDSAKIGDQWPALAAEHNITSFVVGVGDTIDPTELYILAQNEINNVLTVDDFQELNNIVANLTQNIEKSIEGQSGNQTQTANQFTSVQLGFSAAYGSDEDVLVGAVGAYDYTGTVFRYKNFTDSDPAILKPQDISKIIGTLSGSEYLGYSLDTGKFTNSSTEFAAVGMPRNGLKGSVMIYDINNVSIGIKLNGPQSLSGLLTGSYFGGTLLAVDINKDGIDDLVVAAQLFVGTTYDEGIVFVYMGQETLEEMETLQPLKLHGNLSGGRFGQSMATAGDLNQDGFNDLIISAPYADDGSGVVYIYHGTATGVKTTAAQIIKASDISDITLKYFGLSLQGNIDVDDNLYPDIVIGAPLSEDIIILRTRPILTITKNVTFSETEIDLFRCLATDNQHCTNVSICISFSGMSISDVVGIHYNLSVDVHSADKRVTIGNRESHSVVYEASFNTSTTFCQSYGIFLVDSDTGNFAQPVVTSLSINLLESYTALPLSSVLNKDSSIETVAEIGFKRQCGEDRVCHSNVVISVEDLLPSSELNVNGATMDLTQNNAVLVVDSPGEKILIKGNISNSGEHAFGTNLQLSYSSDLYLSQIKNFSTSITGIPNCLNFNPENIVTNSSQSSVIVQVIGHKNLAETLMENDWCAFELVFGFDGLINSGVKESVSISVVVSSNVRNATSLLNESSSIEKWERIYPVRYRSDFKLEKTSVDVTVVFNHTEPPPNLISVEEIGKGTEDIQMRFQVLGEGPGIIPLVEIMLNYPNSTLTGDNLLYLYEITCDGDVPCVCENQNINILNLTISDPSPTAVLYNSSKKDASLNLTTFLVDILRNITEDPKLNITTVFTDFLLNLKENPKSLNEFPEHLLYFLNFLRNFINALFDYIKNNSTANTNVGNNSNLMRSLNDTIIALDIGQILTETILEVILRLNLTDGQQKLLSNLNFADIFTDVAGNLTDIKRNLTTNPNFDATPGLENIQQNLTAYWNIISTQKFTNNDTDLAETTDNSYKKLDCGNPSKNTNCRNVKCNITGLKKDAMVKFSAKFRLWTSSLNLTANLSTVDLSSVFTANSLLSPLIIDKLGRSQTTYNESLNIKAIVFEKKNVPEEQSIWWIIILASIGGVGILIAIIIILYKKTNFFKRTYKDMKDKEEEEDDIEYTDYADDNERIPQDDNDYQN